MAAVTIEGSITPSTYLAMGARATVERTEFIDMLIQRGYVVVISEAAAEPEPTPVKKSEPRKRTGRAKAVSDE